MGDLSVLRSIIRDEPEPPVPAPESPGPQPCSEPQRLPSMLPGSQMTIPDQARAVLTHALAAFRLRMRTLRSKDAGLIHGMRTGKPPSIEEHLSYGDRCAWVPAGHDGGSFEKLGVAWNRSLGVAGVALGNWISATSHKPMRALGTFVICYAVSAGALYAFGLHALALWMLGCLLLVAVLAGIAIAVAPGHYAGRQQQDDQEYDDYEEENS